jgi:hypothetical protein
MFSAGMTSNARSPQRLKPPSEDNFSGWEAILAPLITAGSAAYTVGQSKDIEEAKMQAQASITAMQEQTKRMELELQEKQLELLSQSSESNQLMKTPIAGVDFSSPKTLALLGGIGLGVGLLTYFIFKK